MDTHSFWQSISSPFSCSPHRSVRSFPSFSLDDEILNRAQSIVSAVPPRIDSSLLPLASTVATLVQFDREQRQFERRRSWSGRGVDRRGGGEVAIEKWVRQE